MISTHLVIQTDDGPGERPGDHLEKVGGVSDPGRPVPALLPDVADEEGGEVFKVVGAGLQPHEEDDGEPVEHVVHRGAGEGAPELVPITHLGAKD